MVDKEPAEVVSESADLVSSYKEIRNQLVQNFPGSF